MVIKIAVLKDTIQGFIRFILLLSAAKIEFHFSQKKNQIWCCLQRQNAMEITSKQSKSSQSGFHSSYVNIAIFIEETNNIVITSPCILKKKIN
jgi:hypothetical protein